MFGFRSACEFQCIFYLKSIIQSIAISTWYSYPLDFTLSLKLQTKIYEGSCPCWLQACWWLTRPMQDRHVQLQWLQLKVWSGYWGSLDLLPMAFLLTVGPVGVLKGGDNLMDGAVPGLMVVVNVAGTESLEGVFKTFLWCSSVMVASGEFTIEGYLGQAMTPRSETCPAQHSYDFSNMASTLVTSAWSRTSTLVM